MLLIVVVPMLNKILSYLSLSDTQKYPVYTKYLPLMPNFGSYCVTASLFEDIAHFIIDYHVKRPSKTQRTKQCQKIQNVTILLTTIILTTLIDTLHMSRHED